MSGSWSPWERVSDEEIRSALGKAAALFGGNSGWCREIHTVWRNGWCSVSVRTSASTSLGVSIDHAFFRTALSGELTWGEKQRIKDELFGIDRMAVEVYPRKEDLVDEADMYHLWVFPSGTKFDFGLGRGQL